MEITKEKFFEALGEIAKEKRNFVQTVELIINLKDFDFKKESISLYVELEGIEKKVGVILEKAMDVGFDVAEWQELEAMQPKQFKKYASQYDYFVTTAKLVPLIAKKFGKILGPMKKMPDPKLGSIVTEANEEKIKAICERLRHMAKIVNDKNSVKLAIGKENTDKEVLFRNFVKVVDAIEKSGKHIKELLIKLTMSKPVKLA
jgi:ribosomal protein L1